LLSVTKFLLKLYKIVFQIASTYLKNVDHLVAFLSFKIRRLIQLRTYTQRISEMFRFLDSLIDVVKIKSNWL